MLDVVGGGTRAMTTLALLNARGYSRRMTGAIVPLALLLAVGTVQSGASNALVEATGRHVRESVVADLVVPGPASDREAAAVAGLPGVASTAVVRTVPAKVRLDEDYADLPVLDTWSWETSSLLVVPDGGGFVDPEVVAGSLAALADGHAIAVSRDAAPGMTRIGDPVDVRLGGTETRFVVAAIYERGLALGDYLIGAAGADRAGAGPVGGRTLLVRVADDADVASVRTAIRATGLTATDVDGYARGVQDGAARQQNLSTALLLALLALVLVMAANTLVITTRSRRSELARLQRAGATRAQVLKMILTESMIATATALLVGLACALPALAGVGQGLLGAPVPDVDLGVLGALTGTVALAGVAVPLLTAVGATRPR